jgi:hypothetical protein
MPAWMPKALLAFKPAIGIDCGPADNQNYPQPLLGHQNMIGGRAPTNL